MLPDLPKLKIEFRKRLTRHFSRLVNGKLGIINEAPRQTLREGNRMRTVRADGSVSEDGLKLASAEMRIGMDDIPTMSAADLLQRLDGMAEDMARQMSEHFFRSVGETLDEAGQSVDFKGRRLSGEAILAMYEKMQFDFDREGRPRLPSVIVSPGKATAMSAALDELQYEPLKGRFEELILRKWVDWRDREASRKLVG